MTTRFPPAVEALLEEATKSTGWHLTEAGMIRDDRSRCPAAAALGVPWSTAGAMDGLAVRGWPVWWIWAVVNAADLSACAEKDAVLRRAMIDRLVNKP